MKRNGFMLFLSIILCLAMIGCSSTRNSDISDDENDYNTEEGYDDYDDEDYDDEDYDDEDDDNDDYSFYPASLDDDQYDEIVAFHEGYFLLKKTESDFDSSSSQLGIYNDNKREWAVNYVKVSDDLANGRWCYVGEGAFYVSIGSYSRDYFMSKEIGGYKEIEELYKSSVPVDDENVSTDKSFYFIGGRMLCSLSDHTAIVLNIDGTYIQYVDISGACLEFDRNEIGVPTYVRKTGRESEADKLAVFLYSKNKYILLEGSYYGKYNSETTAKLTENYIAINNLQGADGDMYYIVFDLNGKIVKKATLMSDYSIPEITSKIDNRTDLCNTNPEDGKLKNLFQDATEIKDNKGEDGYEYLVTCNSLSFPESVTYSLNKKYNELTATFALQEKDNKRKDPLWVDFYSVNGKTEKRIGSTAKIKAGTKPQTFKLSVKGVNKLKIVPCSEAVYSEGSLLTKGIFVTGDNDQKQTTNNETSSETVSKEDSNTKIDLCETHPFVGSLTDFYSRTASETDNTGQDGYEYGIFCCESRYPSTITYLLDGKYKKLSAVFALSDDSRNIKEPLWLEFYSMNGDKVKKKLGTTNKFKAGSKPQKFTVSLAGVDELKIVATSYSIHHAGYLLTKGLFAE